MGAAAARRSRGLTVKRARLLQAGVVVAGALALTRLVQAMLGTIPAARATGELGLVVALAVVAATAAAAMAGGPSQSDRTRGLVMLTLAAWGATGVLPLWHVAHPPASLYEGELGGATREITTPPAPADGRYVIDAAGRVRASGRGTFFLRAIAGGSERTLAGDAAEPAHPVELLLARGQTLRVFVESSDGRVFVRVRAPTVPHGLMQLLALLVALLALAVDAIALAIVRACAAPSPRRSRPRSPMPPSSTRSRRRVARRRRRWPSWR